MFVLFSYLQLSTTAIFDLFCGRVPANSAGTTMPLSLFSQLVKATQYGVKAGLDLVVSFKLGYHYHMFGPLPVVLPPKSRSPPASFHS
jgi:hypothetical protein